MLSYQHEYHAGNHADVLKHVVLLALCEALTAKPSACFALDTHAGRGLYKLDGEAAQTTGEAQDGIARLQAEAPRDPAIQRYLAAVRACRTQHGGTAYPGSPWLLAHALREIDRIAACELHPEEAAVLKQHFSADPRIAMHARDGYAGLKALLPPKHGTQKFARGLVLIDPPFEAQLAEFDIALTALKDGLARWPQGIFTLWFPIKQGRALQPFRRAAAKLPAKSALLLELLVRPDDSPLRMNGSGMLILNAPWQFDAAMRPTLDALRRALGEPGASARVEWLREAA